MADGDADPRSAAATERRPRPIPEGYRQGLITAITVLLGFSLAFLRFWGFEASGAWSLGSLASTGTTLVAITMQLISLLRALRLEDDDPREYRKTVHWFIWSAVAILFGLIFAMIESAMG